MIRVVATIALALDAASAVAQSSLGADLDRASSRYAPAATDTTSAVDQLVAKAAEHFRGGRIDEAVATLDRAAGQAYASGATGKAYELSLTAAEARRSQGQLLDAARRYRDQALTNPRDPRAAKAHFAACDAMAAIVDPTPDVLDEYDQLLRQHANTWPDAGTADVAQWRRVELLAKRQRWERLLNEVRTVDTEDPRYLRARELLVVAHASLLREGASRERFEAARGELESIVVGSPPRWPAEWTPLQRDAALALARGALDLGDDGVGYAQQLLSKGLKGTPLPSITWRQEAATLAAVAALAQHEIDAAGGWLHDGGFRLRPQEVRRVLSAALAQIPRAAAIPLSRQADDLLDTLTALAHAEDGSEGASLRRAKALRQAGRDDAALKQYAELAEQRPDDRSVQVAYATLLGKSSAPEDRDKALQRWRAIEARTKPSTDEWFDARLARLRLMIERGDRDAAAKLLSLTRLLAPTLGGERLRGEFADLASELGIAWAP
ncbi:MAG: hypothetical protein AAF266_03215 [Planctomycetota bacterium]